MQLIDRRTLVIGGALGSGSFGVVRLGDLLIENKKYKKCAIKELNENGGQSKELMDEIIRMSNFKHANILEIYGYSFEERMFRKGKKLIMVMEYCEKGSLDKRLKKDPKLSPKKMLKFSIQIANGMCYLASKGFVHRDLAARNILLTNDEQTVKIGDFGLSRFLNGEQYYFARENTKYPFLWTPPEFWEDQTRFGRARRFSTKSDVWGFGVTMWEMFSHGKRPWKGLEKHEVIKLILRREILEMPQDCPLQIWEVMKQCWTYASSNRPDFKAIKDKLDEIDEEFDCESTPVSQVNNVDYTQVSTVVNDDSYLNPTSIDLSKDVNDDNVEMLPINITQQTAKLNTCQSTSCYSSPINLEVDEQVESESEGFDASSNNIRQQDLEGNKLLDHFNNDSKSQSISFQTIPIIPEPDPNVENGTGGEESLAINQSINNDPERLLKLNMAAHDKDPVYRCLCGVHVRNASLIWSIISLLLSGIVIYLALEVLSEPPNRVILLIYILPSLFNALTTLFIPCGRKFKLPQLYLPFLFINAVILLLCGFFLLYIFFNPIESFLKDPEFQELIKEETIIERIDFELFIYYVICILMYSINVYFFIVVRRAYQYLCLWKEVERRLNALLNP